MKKILITGGTGSLGQALIARWRDKHELRILSRNPHRQQMVQEKFGLDPSAFVLADICDYEAVTRACAGRDILIHAAALKTVAQGEMSPDEYLRVNALGSQVVARAWSAARNKPDPDNYMMYTAEPRRALYINSDKAVSPINFYGCSKRIGETLFASQGFGSIRYGNVVESEGSFIHKWERLRAEGKPLTVRIPLPTRFFLTADRAVDLIEEALKLMAGEPVMYNGLNKHSLPTINGIFIPNSMKSFGLKDVALAMTPPGNICHGMLQAGEKQHEILVQEGEVTNKKSDLLSVAIPGRTNDLPFSSETAERMDPKDVLQQLGVSPLQEVFC